MKEQILEILKDKEKATSQIASIINKNYYDCLKILEELEIEGIIKRIKLGSYTFWRVKNGDKN